MKSFMQSEIFEQPLVLNNLINEYVDSDNQILIDFPLSTKKIVLVASGSSYHCASLIANLFNMYSEINASYEYASEFVLNKLGEADKEPLYIFISQSGETSDALVSLRKVKQLGAKTMCVTNGKDSTMWKLCDYMVLSDAGEEKSIASTKALSAQILCLYLVMLKITKDESSIKSLRKLPEVIENFLKSSDEIIAIADKLSKFEDLAILGNKALFSLAQEGSLKIKETSYVNANAYPQGEFLHGHVAFLNNGGALICLVCENHFEQNIKNLKKINEDYDNPTIVAICPEAQGNAIDKVTNLSIKLKFDTPIEYIFQTLILLQLLALGIATKLGRDIDTPKGLSKVVIN